MSGGAASTTDAAPGRRSRNPSRGLLPCRRSCRSSELLTLSCSCRLDALVRLTELTELTALMPSSGQSRSTCASSCRLTATLRPHLHRTPFTTVDPCRHSDCSTLFHTAQIDCRRVMRKISPNEFDRHDPSAPHGLGALDDRILSLCLSLPLLWELHPGLYRALQCLSLSCSRCKEVCHPVP